MSHLKDENSLCLRNHLGNRLGSSDSSSSDSADDSEFEELFNLLKPPPIPAEIIRERSIYRAPSPEISEDHTSSSFDGVSTELDNKVQTSGHYNNVKGPNPTTSERDVRRASDGGKKVSFKNGRAFFYLASARQLAEVQHVIHNYDSHISLGYLEVLEKFRENVDLFGDSIPILKSDRSTAICSLRSMDEIVMLENNILNFKVLLSTFYAYILSNCLLIIRQSYEFRREKKSLINKSINLIGSMGNIDEIKKKILYRHTKTFDSLTEDLNIGPLVDANLTNDEILKELNILTSDNCRKTRKKNKNKKSLTKIWNNAENINTQQFGSSSQQDSPAKVGSRHRLQHPSGNHSNITEIEINDISNTPKISVGVGHLLTPKKKVHKKNTEIETDVQLTGGKGKKTSTNIVHSSDIKEHKMKDTSNYTRTTFEAEVTVKMEQTDKTEQLALFKRRKTEEFGSTAQDDSTEKVLGSGYSLQDPRSGSNFNITENGINDISNTIESSFGVGRILTPKKKRKNNKFENETDTHPTGIAVNTTLTNIESSSGIKSTSQYSRKMFEAEITLKMGQSSNHKDITVCKTYDNTSDNKKIGTNHTCISTGSTFVNNVFDESKNVQTPKKSKRKNKTRSTNDARTCPIKQLTENVANPTAMSINHDSSGRENNAASFTFDEDTSNIPFSTSSNKNLEHVKMETNSTAKTYASVAASIYRFKEEFSPRMKCTSTPEKKMNNGNAGRDIFGKKVSDEEKPVISPKKKKTKKKKTAKALDLQTSSSASTGYQEKNLSSTVEEKLETEFKTGDARIEKMANISNMERLSFIRGTERDYHSPEALCIKRLTDEEKFEKVKIINQVMGDELSYAVDTLNQGRHEIMNPISISRNIFADRVLDLSSDRKDTSSTSLPTPPFSLQSPKREEIIASTEYDSNSDNKNIETEDTCISSRSTFVNKVSDKAKNVQTPKRNRPKKKTKSTNDNQTCSFKQLTEYDDYSTEISIEQDSGDRENDAFFPKDTANISSFSISTMETNGTSQEYAPLMASRRWFVNESYHEIEHVSTSEINMNKKPDGQYIHTFRDKGKLKTKIENNVSSTSKYSTVDIVPNFFYDSRNTRTDLCSTIHSMHTSSKYHSNVLKPENNPYEKEVETSSLDSPARDLLENRVSDEEKRVISPKKKKRTRKKKTTRVADLQTNSDILLVDQERNVSSMVVEKLETDFKTDCVRIGRVVNRSMDVQNSKIWSVSHVGDTEADYSLSAKSSSDEEKLEVEKIIGQIMNNKFSSDIARNSMMRQIEYTNLKIMSALNFLQYNTDTMEIKYPLATFATLKDYLTVLHNIGKFNSLLRVSKADKLNDLEKNYMPISNVCQAHHYAYILSATCAFLMSLKGCLETDRESLEILHDELYEMIEAFGYPEEIYRKFQCRDDKLYAEFIQQVSSIIPGTPVVLNNLEILQSFSNVKNLYTSNITAVEFLIPDKRNNTQFLYKSRLPIIQYFSKFIEFESIFPYRESVERMIMLQDAIQNWDLSPTDFNEIFENVKEFIETLQVLENVRPKQKEFGNFVTKLIEHIDSVVNLYMLRILVCHFYSFIFYISSDFIRKLPKVLTETAFNSWRSKIVDLLSSLCQVELLREKLQFRNDVLYLRLSNDLFRKQGVLVPKSSNEILEEIYGILGKDGIEFDKIDRCKSSTSISACNVSIESEKCEIFRVQTVSNSVLEFMRSGRKPFFSGCPNPSGGGQKIYLTFFSIDGDDTYDILNFKLKFPKKTAKNVFLSIMLPNKSEIDLEYRNYNNKLKIFFQNSKNFSMEFLFSGRETEEREFWYDLLEFARDTSYNDLVSQLPVEETKNSNISILNILERNTPSPKAKRILNRKKQILIEVSTLSELQKEKRSHIKFHTFTGVMLYLISTEMNELINIRKFPDVSTLKPYFKEVFSCILKRIMEMDVNPDAAEISLDFELCRQNQIFTLKEVSQFLITSQHTVSYVKSPNPEIRKQYLSRFLSWFDVPIFHSYIPYGYLEDIAEHVSGRFKKNNFEKIEFFLFNQIANSKVIAKRNFEMNLFKPQMPKIYIDAFSYTTYAYYRCPVNNQIPHSFHNENSGRIEENFKPGEIGSSSFNLIPKNSGIIGAPNAREVQSVVETVSSDSHLEKFQFFENKNEAESSWKSGKTSDVEILTGTSQIGYANSQGSDVETIDVLLYSQLLTKKCSIQVEDTDLAMGIGISEQISVENPEGNLEYVGTANAFTDSRPGSSGEPKPKRSLLDVVFKWSVIFLIIMYSPKLLSLFKGLYR